MKKHPTEQSKARQLNLFIEDRSLFEKLCDLHDLQAGLKAVKTNDGSPGIDRVSVEHFESRLDEELDQLKKDLEGWSYKPSPVRRVGLVKPGKGAGVRMLGVPSVRDRVVHATLKLLLEPILDPTFSDLSYGFRPGYNQQQAVETARRRQERQRVCNRYRPLQIFRPSKPRPSHPPAVWPRHRQTDPPSDRYDSAERSDGERCGATH
jgi:retron-type reverse transcriptase